MEYVTHKCSTKTNSVTANQFPYELRLSIFPKILLSYLFKYPVLLPQICNIKTERPSLSSSQREMHQSTPPSRLCHSLLWISHHLYRPTRAITARYPKGHSATTKATHKTLATSKKEHLHRYLLKLLRFTFSIDTNDLHAAFDFPYEYSSDDNASSVLSAVGRNSLLRLSRLVKRLQKKCAENEWLTTAEKDRDTVYDAVIVPLKSFGLCSAYVLDPIRTYADHGRKPELWNYILIARWSSTG